MKIFLKVSRNIFLIIMILIIGINLYLGFGTAITKNPVMKIFGFSQLYVLSGSMEPSIWAGDIIIIHEQDNYNNGDVITYMYGNYPFTHRIVGMEDGLYILKGDNNNKADDPVSKDKISGKVIFVIPKLGHLIIFLKTPIGMLSMLILMILFIYGNKFIYCSKFIKKVIKKD